VVSGGVDDRGAALGPDLQGVQVVVVVDQDRSDGLGLVLPGLDIGGQDLLFPFATTGIKTLTEALERASWRWPLN
jgi:hypothetical protein